MTTQSFVDDSIPSVKAAWLNQIDVFVNTLFAAATTAAQARAALGATAMGESIFTAASAAAVRSLIAAQLTSTELDALAALATTGTMERTGAAAYTTYTVTTFAKTILDDTTAAGVLATLGITPAGTSADLFSQQYYPTF